MPSFVDLQAPTERNPRVTFAQPAAVHALKLGKKKWGEMEILVGYEKMEGLLERGMFCSIFELVFSVFFFLFRFFFARGNGCV